jgi:hypothetical protein
LLQVEVAVVVAVNFLLTLSPTVMLLVAAERAALFLFQVKLQPLILLRQ